MMLVVGTFLLIGAVVLGGVIVVLLQRQNQDKIIKILLALSGGFLLALAFVHLIPEIYEENAEIIGYYVLLGFLIQLFLEFFSGGIEHGHVHEQNIKGSIPWTLFIALSFHSFLEAMPLDTQLEELQTTSGLLQSIGKGSSALLWGLILHKIPVAIALMTMLLASGFTKQRAWMVLIAFAMMSPLGMFVGHYGANNIGLNLEIILAIVIGMFLHISTTIVFESSDHHKFNYVKLISILGGVGLALLAI